MLTDDQMDRMLGEAGEQWRSAQSDRRNEIDASAIPPELRRNQTASRRWRTPAAIGGGAALVAASVALLVAVQPSHTHRPTTIKGANPDHLDPSEYALALRVAHRDAAYPREPRSGSSTTWPATVRSAAALVLPIRRAGEYIAAGGSSHTAVHARVLVVRVVSSFPHVAPGGTSCPANTSSSCDTTQAITSLTTVINLRTGKNIVRSARTQRHPAQLPDATVLYQRTAASSAAFRLRLHLDTLRAPADGQPIHATVTVTNHTGKPVTIYDACNGWLSVGLTTARIRYDQINGDVACASMLLKTGTTKIHIAVSTRYQECKPGDKPTGDPNLPNCLKSSQMPPLPAGRYNAVIKTMSLNHHPAKPHPTAVRLTGK